MRIRRAENLGFCSGVERALRMAETCLVEEHTLYATGDLVHNRQVIERLVQKGLQMVTNLDEVPDGASFLVRAHGISREEAQELERLQRERGLRVVDATCPCVQHIFELARQRAEAGDRVMIFGEHGHPEVEAARSWAGSGALVVANLRELEGIPQNSGWSVAVVAQSTLEQALFSILEQKIRRDFPIHVVFNTICSATRLRQEAAVALAQQVDRMIVIGGLHSANTRHLYDLCLRVNSQTLFIESARDLPPDWLAGAEEIGVTAGASTPEWIIEEVETKVMEWEKQVDTPEGTAGEQTEKKDAETVTEEVTNEVTEEVSEKVTETSSAPEATPEEAQPEDQDSDTEPVSEEVPQQEDANVSKTAAPHALEEALEMGAFDLPRHAVGDVIKATVVNVRSDEVMVDVGLKSEGIIPRRELSYDPSLAPEDIVKVGDEIEVEVMRSEDQEGHITFSKRRADQRKHWDKIIEIFEKGEIIEGKIVDAIKGGLLVDIGVRGFMPASQAERRFTSDLKHLVGTMARVKLIEVDREKRRAIVSRKAVLDLEAEAAKDAFWGRVQEGEIIKGVVRRLTDFGAFVDLGGVDGLLHISDMAYHRVSKPSDIVSIGQELELKILKLSPDTGKVSLGLKQIQPKPWEALTAEIHPNDIIEGTVVRITAWGAFVNVRPGIDGLIHISELDNRRVAKVEDVIAIGDKVQVLVLGISPEQERLSLSLKALKPMEPEDVEAFEEIETFEEATEEAEVEIEVEAEMIETPEDESGDVSAQETEEKEPEDKEPGC